LKTGKASTPSSQANPACGTTAQIAVLTATSGKVQLWG